MNKNSNKSLLVDLLSYIRIFQVGTYFFNIDKVNEILKSGLISLKMINDGKQ